MIQHPTELMIVNKIIKPIYVSYNLDSKIIIKLEEIEIKKASQ